MRNPLQKRLPRELRTEFGKYVVIFLFIFGMIAFVSGYLVASNSMIAAYQESFTKYVIEDGNLTFSAEPDDETLRAIEDKGALRLDPIWYKEEDTAEVDSALRIFQKRTVIDLECLMQGEFPEKADEIAIDRMYADNNSLTVGDSLTVAGKRFSVTGLVALSDYSALYQNPSDMMFDASRFGVAVVTPEGFDSLRDTHLHYCYGWRYDSKPADDRAAKQQADDLLDDISDILKDKAEDEAAAIEEEITAAVMRGEDPSGIEMPEFLTITGFLPEYLNQAIIFTGTDMGGDRLGFIIFLYMIIAIIAFVSAVTTSNTITKEAAVIGTLRASGYTRGELVRHYMTMPLIVTLSAAILGNVVGYGFFVQPMASIYYQSYSLPTFVTLWNADAFLQTTVIPVILMLLINWIMLTAKLRISPIDFMRGNLNPNRRRKAFRLNTKIPILHRFRLRIIFQNIPSYIVLGLGIFLGNFILLFGLGFTPFLQHYQDVIVENMLSEYQYVLKTPEDPEDEAAEQFCLTSLETIPGRLKSEDVSIYGLEPDSRYLTYRHDSEDVSISTAYANKFHLTVGDTIEMREKYENKQYTFRVGEIIDYPAGLAVFVENDRFRSLFGKAEDYYTGWLSDHALTKLDDDNIAVTITKDDLTKTSRQLMRSMGSVATIFKVFSMVLFVLLIYLLAKIIIEKNSQSISMTKIFGYSGAEIGGLYVAATAVIVLLSIGISMPVGHFLMGYVMELAMSEYPGFLEYYVPGSVFVQMALLGVASFAVVAALLFFKIRRIPMADALKNRD